MSDTNITSAEAEAAPLLSADVVFPSLIVASSAALALAFFNTGWSVHHLKNTSTRRNRLNIAMVIANVLATVYVLQLFTGVIWNYRFATHPSYFTISAFLAAVGRITSYTASLIYIFLVIIRFRLIVQGIHQYSVWLERVIMAALVFLYIPGAFVLTGFIVHLYGIVIPAGEREYDNYVMMVLHIVKIHDAIYKILYLVLDNILGIILVLTISKVRKGISIAQSECSFHSSSTQSRMLLYEHSTLMKETLLYLTLWVIVTWFHLGCYIFNIPEWTLDGDSLYNLQNLLGTYGEVFGVLQFTFALGYLDRLRDIAQIQHTETYIRATSKTSSKSTGKRTVA
ncbi:hypothetical protein HK102_004460 [Quaeritorhiza haematococci]|nr:hypothetical protein HK102_004460 [Quaeritorhiza haematococci]